MKVLVLVSFFFVINFIKCDALPRINPPDIKLLPPKFLSDHAGNSFQFAVDDYYDGAFPDYDTEIEPTINDINSHQNHSTTTLRNIFEVNTEATTRKLAKEEDSNYSFKYHVDDPKTDDYHGHEESRQGNVVRGRYYVLLPDGIRQIVDYVADSTGYHPTITYERISRKNK